MGKKIISTSVRLFLERCNSKYFFCLHYLEFGQSFILTFIMVSVKMYGMRLYLKKKMKAFKSQNLILMGDINYQDICFQGKTAV